MHVSAIDLNSDWRIDLPEKEVTLSENSNTEVWSGACPEPPKEKATDPSAPSGTVVVHARLVDRGGSVLARFSDWPQPYKFLDLPDPGLKVDVKGDEVVISAKKPVKGVWLDVDGDDEGVDWADNSVSDPNYILTLPDAKQLDLFPGDEQRIVVRGLKERAIVMAYLGNEKAKAV